MTNFDFLRSDPRLAGLADWAEGAEALLRAEKTGDCITACCRTMTAAVQWMYAADSDLTAPYQDSLAAMMNEEAFRTLVGEDVWRRMNYIRKLAGAVARGGKRFLPEQAALCVENLFYFLDELACFYAEEYVGRPFDAAVLTRPLDQTPPALPAEAPAAPMESDADRAALAARRAARRQTYVPKPLALSEYRTRKLYIDFMLQDAGWTEGKDWLNEVELPGMPNRSEVGFADYVLYGDDGRALAVLEAKRTCVDVAKGRQQAKLYADLLEKQYGRRPVIFLSNGFDTRMQDNLYPERRVASVYSKRDLEKLFNLQAMRTDLSHAAVNKSIAGRYYQEGAIKAVCDALGVQNRRKALLVMATGSGKTRTVIALCDVLLRHGWVKNVLFLADRTPLVTQAMRSFVNLLPDFSVTNLCEEKDNLTAHGVFSTYQTMMNLIDTAKDDAGKLFTVGHFDLVICDEAHRSVYNKYREIFHYFDAPLVGLTATPKDDIDKNTYEVFDLQNGVPTYGYELAQAVKDGFLVDYVSVETKLKFLEQGIVYDELSDEDKEEYENTFVDDNGDPLDHIRASALNEWVFNEDTIRRVLHELMENGLKIDYGQRLGKTIVFAKNHRHAETIYDIFNREYPHLPGFAKVIDNQTNYAQTLIDEFSDPKKLPQIAISVDMMDTGIDVPEVLNLVFFKKVMSKAKFWQMIGRGTRLCPALLDGKDKEKFYIFDFCGNFEFFRMNKARPVAAGLALPGAIFSLKAQMAMQLQDLAYQTDALQAFRRSLVDDMARKVRELNKEHFAVRQHLQYVEQYADPDSYQTLTYEDTLMIRQELAPLILPDADDAGAVRFDALMYGMELALLAGKNAARYHTDLLRRAAAVASVANIPEIAAQSALLDRILHTDYVATADVQELEHIRQCLRGLMKYIPVDGAVYSTNFADELLQTEWNEAELENDDLQNYKAKAEYYIRQHQDNAAITKLKNNQPLTAADVQLLETVLWSEVGTKEEYEAEYGRKPLGELVREVVGLDMAAAKAAFADYLNDVNLDSRQIYFVNQIVEYIVKNGMMKDLAVLQEPPFTDRGSVVEVFTDAAVWLGIRAAIERVNANARVA